MKDCSTCAEYVELMSMAASGRIQECTAQMLLEACMQSTTGVDQNRVGTDTWKLVTSCQPLEYVTFVRQGGLARLCPRYRTTPNDS
jgi:hypothetical protein